MDQLTERLPNFSKIKPEQIEPQIVQILDNNRARLKALLAQPQPFTWENLMAPLEDLSDELNRKWSPISHLHSVLETDALREAYNKTIPLLSSYHTELSQNVVLFNAIASLGGNHELKELNPAQQKIIENDIRDFKLSGVNLPTDKKAQLAELVKDQSQLSTTFSEHLLDATQGWVLHLTDDQQLEGLPTQAVQLAKENAKLRNLEGYVITLDYPSYSSAIRFLVDRNLRKELYTAYTTRASDQGPDANKWDNTPIMDAILKNRQEMAALVGFKNFAEYSLATKMAKTPKEVLSFLKDLVARTKEMGEKEYQEVVALAKQEGLEKLEGWDTAYYSEKLRESQFQFSPEDLRPYFPIDKVLNGMFSIVDKLYGIRIEKIPGVNVWHPQVEFFAIYDEKNELRGGFYIDLYARPHKKDGAWMDECLVRKRLSNNKIQYPVAYLTCNFMPPVDDQPALLLHDDVLTLFHEFGHCLHHLLTKVDYPSVSGINGVAWDAVEFPSQFMENYCWEKESLDIISGHYQTGAPLPDALYQKMIAAKNFQSGLQMLRQLEFALFDFKLHLEYDPQKPNQVQTILDEVRDEVGVMPTPTFNRFQNSFSHIFAGGYAAGYYSYKWAEVLSSDAYAKFEENGLFDRSTGQSFLQNILEMGGVRDPMLSFVAFRGREPKIDALLRHSGIVGA